MPVIAAPAGPPMRDHAGPTRKLMLAARRALRTLAEMAPVSSAAPVGRMAEEERTVQKLKKEYSSPYELDGRLPLKIAVPLGLQHVLAMFVGNVTALIIVTEFCGVASGSPLQISLFQNAMFIAGVVTLLQIYPVWKVGSRLPIVMGTSAGYIGVFISVSVMMGGGLSSYGAILGAVLIGGMVEVVLGFCLPVVKKLFPPVVTGTVLLAVGLSLVSIGVDTFAGGSGAPDYGSTENLIIAFVVLITTIILKHGTKGMTSNASILLGIIAGYVAAMIMGFFADPTFMFTDPVTGAVSEVTKSWVLDWSKVANASWFSLPQIIPIPITFDIKAILPIGLIFIVMTVETTANISAITSSGMNRRATDKEMSGGIICDGLGSSIASLFGLLPNTSFSQNVGIVAMTKVVNRFSVATGACFLILCGFLPKLVAIISVMPQSVLGGSVAMMFACIMVSGIQLIAQARITNRTFTIVAVAIGIGYGLGSNPAALSGFPDWVNLVIGGSGVVSTAFVAIVLNLLIPKEQEDRDADAAQLQELAMAEASAHTPTDGKTEE